MCVVRASLNIVFLFLCLHLVHGKPFFFTSSIWCDFLCEDDDTSTTTVSSEDDWICGDCNPRPRRTTTTPAPAILAQPLSLSIPNGSPMQVSLTPNGWQIGFMPGSQGAAPPAAPPAAPAAAPAAATTAAPAATTAAGATTAAATTAAPAG